MQKHKSQHLLKRDMSDLDIWLWMDDSSIKTLISKDLQLMMSFENFYTRPNKMNLIDMKIKLVFCKLLKGSYSIISQYWRHLLWKK